eukprot:209398_1
MMSHFANKKRKLDWRASLNSTCSNYSSVLKSSSTAKPTIIFLEEDLKTYHLGDPKRPLLCTVCDKEFANKKGMRSHFATSHDHQIKFTKYIIKNQLDLPSHISAQQPDPHCINTKARKRSTIDAFFTKSKSKSTNPFDSNSDSNVLNDSDDDDLLTHSLQSSSPSDTSKPRCNGVHVGRDILNKITPAMVQLHQIKIINWSIHHHTCYGDRPDVCKTLVDPISRLLSHSINPPKTLNLQYMDRPLLETAYRTLRDKHTAMKLECLNVARHCQTVSSQNMKYHQLIQTLSTQNIPRFGSMLHAHLKSGKGLLSFIELLGKTIDIKRGYAQSNAKSFSEFEMKLFRFIRTVPGGSKILCVMNQLGMSCCPKLVSKSSIIHPIVVTGLTPKHVTSSILSNGNHLGDQVNGCSMDFFYGESNKVDWHRKTNLILGFCFSHHYECLPKYFNTAQDAMQLFRMWKCGIIHKSQRYMIPIQYGLNKSNKRDAIYHHHICLIPDCAQYSGDSWPNLFIILFESMNDPAIVKQRGPTIVISSDCETMFKPIMKALRHDHGVVMEGFRDSCGDYISPKTLYKCVTEDKDTKHIIKKFRNSLINDAKRILTQIVTPSILKDVFIFSGERKQRVDQLLNYKDEHNVDLVIQFFSELGIVLAGTGVNDVLRVFMIQRDPIQYNEAQFILPELNVYVIAVNSIINGMFASKINLQTRITMILKGTIIIKCLWLKSGRQLFSEDTMHATICHITAIFHIVHFMKSDERYSGLDLLLLLLGSDLSELSHFYIRFCVAYTKGLTHLQAQQRLPLVQDQLNFAMEFPELCPKRKRVQSGDNMNVRSYQSELKVSDVNLFDCIAMAKVGANEVFEELLVGKDAALLQSIQGERETYLADIKKYNELRNTFLHSQTEHNVQSLLASSYARHNPSSPLVDMTRDLSSQTLSELKRCIDNAKQLDTNQIVSIGGLVDISMKIERVDDHENNKITEELNEMMTEIKIDYTQSTEYEPFVHTSTDYKVHKTSLLRELLEDGVSYYTDRNLNCMRVQKSIKNKKRVEITYDFDDNCVHIGDTAITLLAHKRYLHCVLIKITKIKVNQIKQNSVQFTVMANPSIAVSFDFCACSGIQVKRGKDNEDDMYWCGQTMQRTFTLKSAQHVAFPVFKSDDTNNAIIKTNTTELHNASVALIGDAIDDSKYCTINEDMKQMLRLPYDESLVWIKGLPTNKTKKKPKQKKKKNQDDKLKTNHIIKCLNCGDPVELRNMPLHTMKHELEGELRSERLLCDGTDLNLSRQIDVPCNVKEQYVCYFCGKRSLRALCEVTIVLPPGKSANYLISCACLGAERQIQSLMYSRLSNFSESSPYRNHPTVCKICHCIIWRWNAVKHYKNCHPHPTVCHPNLIVSKFEKDCVKLVNYKGNFKKDAIKYLLKEHGVDCKAKLPNKTNLTKPKPKPKKKKKKKKKSNPKPEMSDEEEDDQNTNNKEHVVEHVNDHDGNQNTNSKDHEDEIPLIMNRNKRKKKILRDEDTSSEEQWDDDSDDTDDIVTGFEEFE